MWAHRPGTQAHDGQGGALAEALREIDLMERTSGYRSLPEAPVDFANIARAALTAHDERVKGDAA